MLLKQIAKLTVLLLALLYGTLACAQQLPQNPSPSASPSAVNSDQRVTNPPPSPGQPSSTETAGKPAQVQGFITYKTPYEFWLTGLAIALVIVMTILLCVMAAIGKLTQEFYKAFLILVVVFAALFLIVAGYTDTQTAPVFSLLGTIIGYIFGRSATGTTGEPAGNPPAPDPVAPPNNPATGGNAAPAPRG